MRTASTASYADFNAKILRTSFHDAAEVDLTNSTDKNGPDGCLSSSHDNAGLIEPDSILLTSIEAMWQNSCDKISRADFWAMLAIIAVKQAEPTRTISIPYFYGRDDAAVCSYTGSRLPVSELSTNIQTVFANRMGLSITDAVALLGAHTLGHVHPQFSGYGAPTVTSLSDNAWDNTPHVFDNNYYTNLLAPWNNQHANGDRSNNADFTASDTDNMWMKDTGGNIMLNSDMALAYSISQANNFHGVLHQRCSNGGGGCNNPRNSTRPSTLSIVQTFANNNAAFLAAFASAYTKMVNVGYGTSGTAGKLGTLTPITLSTC